MKKTAARILCAALTALFVFGAVCAHAADLPSKYRSDAETPVLNQKNNPLCWAYAGSDLLSISAIKNGRAKGGAAVFSAPMIARAQYDGGEHRHSSGGVWYKCYGGLDYALMAGISGKGLLPESDYPTIESADAAPVSALYGNYAYVDGFVECDMSDLQRKDRTAMLKEWIVKYGAVATDAFIGDYNKVTGVAATKYYDNTKAAHQILLVGWDDTKYTDTGTGAFLMKNTWGQSWGDGGYAWISFNTEFGRTAYAASVSIDPDARILTHTEVDFLTGNHTADKTLYGAVNVFTVKEKLTLRAAGMYTSQKNTEFEARVFINLKDASKAGTATPDAKGTLKATYAGYYSVTLDRRLNVVPGDTVTVLYLAHANGNYYVFSEYSEPDYGLAVTSSQPGQSYTYVGGELKTPRGNYIGTVIGEAEHKDPPVTLPVTEAETEPPQTEPPTEAQTEEPTGAATQDGTDPDTDGAGDQTTFAGGTDDVVIITFGPPDDPESDDPETGDAQSGLQNIKNAALKLLRIAGIIVLVIIAVIVLIVIIAVISSKKKKKR